MPGICLRRIEVSADIRKDIMRRLQLTESGLSRALNFKRDGAVSEEARKLAIAQGGVICCTLPEFETIHDADGKMTQVFPNGARLVIDKHTSEGRIEYNGREVSAHHHVTIAMLARLQHLASSL